MADPSPVQQICAEHGNRPDRLIEILHGVQGCFGSISRAATEEIARALNLSRAEVFGVLSFYDDFSFDGAHLPELKICRAEACQAVGADQLAADCDRAGLAHRAVYCLGNCALGPAALVGDQLIGRAQVTALQKALEKGRGS